MADAEKHLLKVFLCHAKEDKPTVRELYHQLIAEGWMDVWLDEEKLLPGQEWDVEIEKAVEQSDIVVVCLSTHSVDKEGYVQKELRFVLNIADEKPEGTIFVTPLRLDDCQIPRRLRAWQYADYFPQEERVRAHQRLLASLKMRAKKLSILPEQTKTDSAPAVPQEKLRLGDESRKNQNVEHPVVKGANESGVAQKAAQVRLRWIGGFLAGAGTIGTLTGILLQGDGLFFAGVFSLISGLVILVILNALARRKNRNF